MYVWWGGQLNQNSCWYLQQCARNLNRGALVGFVSYKQVQAMPLNAHEIMDVFLLYTRLLLPYCELNNRTTPCRAKENTRCAFLVL